MRPLDAARADEVLDGDENPNRRRRPGAEPEPDNHDRHPFITDAVALPGAGHRRRPAPAGAVIDMPLPDLRTLNSLRAYLPSVGGTATPAARAFMDLYAALAAHTAALGHLDRAEAPLIFTRGGVDADRPTEATDAPQSNAAAHGAAEGLGRCVDGTALGRLRHRGLGSRRRSSVIRETRERRLAERIREAADRLHHAPAEGCGDIALKLAVVIAAGEAGPPDAVAFPWARLRQILAELLAVGIAGT